MSNRIRFRSTFLIVCLFIAACSKSDSSDDLSLDEMETIDDNGDEEVLKDYKLPDIDLNNWKVTLPIGNPSEVEPPEILDYAKNETLKKFMYNDSTDGSLVFYAYPDSSTPNSSYSRTELREQMSPGSNNHNWKFEDGATMRGKLSVPEVSVNPEGGLHRLIIMQIHGRLTEEQRILIGEDDHNAPPILKIYWNNGKIRVKTKVLKDINLPDEEILGTDAWGDGEGFTFSKNVGHEPFNLEVAVTEGRMEITLDDNESIVYEDENIRRWSIFENYFKAGNYLISTDENAFSYVKYYELEVMH